MTIVKNNANGIVSSSDHVADGNIAFARHRYLLAGTMPLHFCGGRQHPHHFRRDFILRTVIEGNRQQMAIL
ncbi:hypothetical protein D3C78_1888670 [compost metagenome]